MLPIRQDFELWTNGDAVEELGFLVNGVEVDLTGYNFDMAVRTAPTANDTVETFLTVASAIEGFYVIEPAAGRVEMRMDRETLDTMFDAVAPDLFIGDRIVLYHDIVWTLPNGDREPLIYGLIILNKGITNG